MAGGVVYGKDLAVGIGASTEPRTESFWIRWVGNHPALGAGDTQGGTERVTGNTDWDGSYRLRGHTPLAFPNDSAVIAGAVQTGNYALSGTARIKEIRMEWPILEGGVILSEVLFGANGTLTPSQAAPALSWTGPSLSAIGMYVKLGENKQSHIDYMRLRVLAPFQVEYADSDTAGQIMRTMHDIDAQAMWRVSTDDPADFPTIGATHICQFYVTDSTYWEIKWMRIVGVDPWGVDRRAQAQGRRAPVQAVVRAEFTGFDGTNAGHIKNPAMATKWP